MIELSNLQKALVYRAVNTEINFLTRLYKKDTNMWPEFQKQVEELQKVQEMIYPKEAENGSIAV